MMRPRPQLPRKTNFVDTPFSYLLLRLQTVPFTNCVITNVVYFKLK